MTSDRALDPAALDRLLDFAGGDAEFVDELIATYLDDAVDQLARMAAAARSGSTADLVIAAHSLKTNSANVGAARLSDLCRSLEADARSGDVPDAVARVEAAEAEFSVVGAELAAIRAGS